MQETSGASENSLAITSPYFQELLEISNVEEVATQNDLTVEENLALLRKNAFRTNKIIIRMIQEQVVASEERSVLKQENANLRQDNIEFKQKDAVKDQDIKHLKRENAEVKQENVVKDQDIKHLKRENAEVKQENVVRDQDIKHLKRENAEVKQENAVINQDIKHLKRVDVEKDRKIEILNSQTGALNSQIGNFTRDNIEFRRIDAVRMREMKDLEDGIYVLMRQSLMKRINSIWWEAFVSNAIAFGPDEGRNDFNLTVKIIFSLIYPVPGITTFIVSEAGGKLLKRDAKLKIENVKKEVLERPQIMRDPEFKEQYRDTVVRIRKRLKTPPRVSRTDRDPSDYNVNVERIAGIRF